MGTYGDAVKGQIYEYVPEVLNSKFVLLTDLIQAIVDTVDDYSHILNNFDKTRTGKQFQMELTLSEAWATIFAEIAIESCGDDYIEVFNINTGIFEDRNPSEYYDGEASEYAVASFLWDLYDGVSNSDNIKGDKIELGAEIWWEITTAPGTYTVQDLVDNILTNYSELIDGVGGLLTNHNIAPNLSNTVVSPCNNGELILQWTPNGGNNYPNDKFKVVFYDENNNVIEESDEVIIINGTSVEPGEKDISIAISSDPISIGDCVCTVSEDLWLSVLTQSGEAPIYAAIYGYRSGAFYSGPYVSSFVSIWNDDSSHAGTTMYDSKTHWEKCMCGFTITEKIPHEITYSDCVSTQHRKSCQICGFSIHENHIYDVVHARNSNIHTFKCACGVIGEEELHSVSRHAMINNFYHYIYCDCGHLFGQERHEWKTSGLFYICKLCGYKRSNFDGPILLIIDKDEEYM